MVSLVVPAISLTMALSSFSNALSKVDFPAFGRPAITVLIPCLITLPSSKERISLFSTKVIFPISSCNWSRFANSTSSSAKSSSSSIIEAKWISCSLNTFSSVLKPPLSWFIATWCAAAESDVIRSATASACDKSSPPFKNALKVNSPGLAAEAPFLISKLMIC
ncbi:hypothetical protein D3C87_1655190 [compost metagenome]